MKENQKLKVAIAMSGGVDSSVAAKILRDEGHKVTGLFLKFWSDPTSPRLRGAGPTCKIDKENRCCDYEALEDARKVAAKLKIPFYVINARDEFKKEVVDYFLEEYKSLKTPNPCIVCNDKIKFGLLLKKALEIGCDCLATGHYARVTQTEELKNLSPDDSEMSGSRSKHRETKEHLECHCEEFATRQSNSNLAIHQFSNDDVKIYNGQKLYHLLTGVDTNKDQSYMLYHLNQNQLSQVLFPLGEMTKIKVRNLAVKWDLPVKEKPESQEICFFGDKDYRAFLKRYLPEKYFKPGKIVDKKGNVLGEHQGLINYTIGQRRGVDQSQISNIKSQNCSLKLKTSSHSERVRQTQCKLREESQDKKPLYVIGYDIKNNRLIVGEDKDIYSKEMIVSDVNWIDLKTESPDDLKMSGSRSALPHRGYNLSVKIRYRHPAVRCKITNCKSQNANKFQIPNSKYQKNNLTIQQFNNVRVVFTKKQRAVTPGQSAVFYLGDEVLGGGIIG